MKDCAQVEGLIAREAGDPAALSADERAKLDAHRSGCAACREASEDQRAVAAVLRAVGPVRVSPAFSARVAARIDDEAAGFLDVLNWRSWTVGLAPVAAALMLAAYFGVGTAATVETPEEVTASFDALFLSNAAETPAAVFLQPSSSADTLLESVLTGTAPARAGGSDER